MVMQSLWKVHNELFINPCAARIAAANAACTSPPAWDPMKGTRSEPWCQSHVDSTLHWLRHVSVPLSYDDRWLHEVSNLAHTRSPQTNDANVTLGLHMRQADSSIELSAQNSLVPAYHAAYLVSCTNASCSLHSHKTAACSAGCVRA